MEHRRLGSTDLTVGVVGLGVEHLNGEPLDQVRDVLRLALDSGINFVDLISWTPALQECLGEVLAGRRDQVILAGHMGMAESEGPYTRTRDLKRAVHDLEASLARLGTDYLDILYCLHNCDEPQDLESLVAPGSFLDMGRQWRKAGRARYLGHSGHVAVAALYVLEAMAPEVVMFPVNMMRADNPVNARFLEICRARKIGVVSMKTYGGGAIFEQCPGVTPVQCISYSLSQPAVATVAIGCITARHVHDALGYLHATDSKLEFHAVLQAAGHTAKGTCVYCNHCQPCPVEIDIAAAHRLLVAAAGGVTAALRADYGSLAIPPSACIQCEDCMERCPFDVEVTANMTRTAELFEG